MARTAATETPELASSPDLAMKVVVFRSKDRDYRWSLRSDNGEVIADSGEGYRRKNYAIKKAEELFPNAELLRARASRHRGTIHACVTRRQLSPSTASSDTSEEREEPVSPDSPTDRDLLLEILGRLRRIEKHFGILENTWEIGDRNGPPAPRGEQGPIEPLRRSKSKRVGKVPRPRPVDKGET